MPTMVSLDTSVGTPGDSQKESLFAERHSRPASASFKQPEAQAVAVEDHGVIYIFNVDRYSERCHAFPLAAAIVCSPLKPSTAGRIEPH
jgi:hypothetical protein